MLLASGVALAATFDGTPRPRAGSYGSPSSTPANGDPRQSAIATDGSVWFTERFTHRIGCLHPATN